VTPLDGIHDLGGMQGFGRILRDEETWHAAWERRVFGLSLVAAAGIGNVHDFRHALERLDPRIYVTAGYFGRWLAALEVRCAERGMLTSDEVDGRSGAGSSVRPTAVPSVSLPTLSKPGPQVRQLARRPRFAVGDEVLVVDIHPDGHTRLPRYIRGRPGTVRLVHPAFVFPDRDAHGWGEDPQYAYAVAFGAGDLWGSGDHTVVVDVFEPHLESR
jgi:nitrile hydratase